MSEMSRERDEAYARAIAQVAGVEADPANWDISPVVDLADAELDKARKEGMDRVNLWQEAFREMNRGRWDRAGTETEEEALDRIWRPLPHAEECRCPRH